MQIRSVPDYYDRMCVSYLGKSDDWALRSLDRYWDGWTTVGIKDASGAW